jgi:hypothetical protein
MKETKDNEGRIKEKWRQQLMSGTITAEDGGQAEANEKKPPKLPTKTRK